MIFATDSGRHSVSKTGLLAAAQKGDERAFAELLAEFRGELHAHCYRMLGSLHDADDALQEALIRAWRGLPDFEGRSSLRRWLYRVATNVCLTMAAQRAKRVLPIDLSPGNDSASEPLAEPLWLEPYPDSSPDAHLQRREDIELAFVAAVQYLPGNERAALLLRDVVGFSAREVANLVDTSVPAVNSALQRARRIVNERIATQAPRDTAGSLDNARIRAIVGGYIDAFERGDVDALVALLTDDVTWSMPPTQSYYRGRTAVAAFLADGPRGVRGRHRRTVANGQPAVGCYLWNVDRQAYVATVIDVLTFRADRIAAVTAFVDGKLFQRFGLPGELPAA